MGITYIEGTVKGPSGVEEAVEFLVDSGAGYSLLPNDVWQVIGLEPTREQQFSLADGTRISRNVSYCYLVLPQGEGYSPVILGEPDDDQALLGVVAFENLGLVLNPFSRTLQPMTLII